MKNNGRENENAPSPVAAVAGGHEPLEGDPMQTQFSHTHLGMQALSEAMSVEGVARAHRKRVVTVRLALSDQSLRGEQTKFGGRWIIDEACADAWARGEKCEHVATTTDSTAATVERWRIPSDSVATLNLTEPPAAVQGARDLLTMNGATRLEEPAQSRYLLESALNETQRHEVRFGENGWVISPVQIENDELAIAQARTFVKELEALIGIAEALEPTQNTREIRRATTVDEHLRNLDDGAYFLAEGSPSWGSNS